MAVRLSIALALSAAVLVAEPATPLRAGVQTQGLTAGLDRYAAGEFDRAVAEMTTPEGLKGAGRWPRELRQWANAATSDERPQRVRVASAFALELLARGVEGTTAEYPVIFPVFETAGELVRREAPSEFEHLFHLAAVALLQGAREESRVVSHARYAAARTPDSRFLLAGATAAFGLHVLASRPLFHGYLSQRRVSTPGSRGDTQTLRQLLALVSRLVDDPSVGLEARLRRGVLTYLMRESGDGLEDFRAATRSTDPHVSYLGRMMLGVLHEQQGRLSEAIAAYRQAQAVQPAPSAVLRLSYALFMHGESLEAGALASNLRRADPFTDPWHLYSLRDYRFWPEYRARLRAMVR